MNIFVCIKQTFATEETIRIEAGQIREEGVQFVINPYDEYALAEAIRLKEQFGGEVAVVSVGPSRAETALRTALAVGADHAFLIDDEALFGDEYTTAKALAAFLKPKPFDFVFCGYMAVDSGAGQGGARLAEELGLAHIAAVTKLDVRDHTVIAERDAEGDTEVIEAALPILITAQQGLSEPRYPSLPGIMKAKKKPIARLSAADLGLDPAAAAAKTHVVEQYAAPKREAGRILQGGIADQAAELARLLDSVVKVG